ncbi:hypothetical protein MTO96_025470 [Rhipicephalus appendiculatus]
MKFLCAILAFLTGCAWAKTVAEQRQLLTKLFGNMMHKKFLLDDVYFTVREEGAPNDSTLYRFNLTNGMIWNMDRLLRVKYDPQTCRVKTDGAHIVAKCEFDIKGAMVTYDAALSYGQPIKENFTVYATIAEFPFGNHINPASLTAIVYKGPGCHDQRMCLTKQCLITNFVLDATTFPAFWNFDFKNFRKNSTLARLVWREFEVNMFTKLRPKESFLILMLARGQ